MGSGRGERCSLEGRIKAGLPFSFSFSKRDGAFLGGGGGGLLGGFDSCFFLRTEMGGIIKRRGGGSSNN